MAARHAIATPNAPAAMGTYSQAIVAGRMVHTAGQIGIDPRTMALVQNAEGQVEQVFRNLQAIAEAAGSRLDDAVQLTVYLVDLSIWPLVNAWMVGHFTAPYPARSAVGVASLPLGAVIEAQAVFALPDPADEDLPQN